MVNAHKGNFRLIIIIITILLSQPRCIKRKGQWHVHLGKSLKFIWLQNTGEQFMLMPVSIEQELNIVTTVAYKCCANHSILMTSPLITALTDGSHSTAVLRLLWQCEYSCGLLQLPKQHLSTPQQGLLPNQALHST